ncbi:unnamed protein product [Sphagnum balticum]
MQRGLRSQRADCQQRRRGGHICGRLRQRKLVNHLQVWHQECFVCAQCFRPFPDGIFYEFEGRKYCEHDFHVLFAPCCGRCGEFIVGRVIKGRALCRECNAKEKAAGLGKYVCHKCHAIIDEGHIKWRGEAYHPYHYNCKQCGTELNSDAREVKRRTILSAVSRQDGHTDMRRVSTADRGEGRDGDGQTLACGGGVELLCRP